MANFTVKQNAQQRGETDNMSPEPTPTPMPVWQQQRQRQHQWWPKFLISVANATLLTVAAPTSSDGGRASYDYFHEFPLVPLQPVQAHEHAYGDYITNGNGGDKWGHSTQWYRDLEALAGFYTELATKQHQLRRHLRGVSDDEEDEHRRRLTLITDIQDLMDQYPKSTLLEPAHHK